jgi:hypothetical protein
MFEEVVIAAGANPWIAARETDRGGHFAFDVAYGKDYIGRVIRLLLDHQVLSNWGKSAEFRGLAFAPVAYRPYVYMDEAVSRVVPYSSGLRRLGNFSQ